MAAVVTAKHDVYLLVKYLALTEVRKAKLCPKQTLFNSVPKGARIFTNIETEFSSIITQLSNDTFTDCYLSNHFIDGNIVVITEPIQHDNIFGRGLCIYNKCLYGISFNRGFRSCRSEQIMAMLGLYCLYKLNQFDIDSIGLVLPAQSTVAIHNIENWNYMPYWNRLITTIERKEKRDQRYHIDITKLNQFNDQLETRVGHHVMKQQVFNYIPTGIPQQIFLGNNKTLVASVSDSFRSQMVAATSQPGSGNIYVHSPYIINLSKPIKSTDYTSEALRDFLVESNSCGCRGLVVHCGKRAGMEESSAIKNMAHRVKNFGGYATKNCPLLIETSSGQGGEILCSPKELADFYEAVVGEPNPLVKICLDTCHVFAAGYEPIQFVTELVRRKIPIGLIHFNDSKVEKGTRKDRHAPIGTGHIGYDQLIGVLDWAIHNGVDCVREY
jgi:deoxyribonuclease-4